MIQPNELRLGNLLRDKVSKTELKIIELAEKDIVTYVIDRSKFPLEKGWSLEPIPLTEEILLKCGLKLITERTKNYMLKGISGEPCFHFNKNNTVSCYKANIKYLHQLQNLYFALTNQELNITL